MTDYLIQDANIIDGTGAPSFVGSVAIEKGKIKAVGRHIPLEGARYVLSGEGLTVTPGFIDTHRHADAALFRDGFGEAEIRQGLTTIVNGNCGQSLTPLPHAKRKDILRFTSPVLGDLPDRLTFETFGEYQRAVDAEHLPLHAYSLIGNGTVCASMAGYASPLSGEDIKKAHRALEKALADGALGISIGLGYLPECLYSTKTMIHLLAPLSGSQKPLTTHIRGEGDSVLRAIGEVIEIAKALHLKLEINHLKCIGRRNQGKTMERALALIQNARENGLDVRCDVYPYRAGSTQLMILMPNRFKEHGTQAFLKSLKDPSVRREITRELQTPSLEFENTVELVGWDHIRMTTLSEPKNKRFEMINFELKM